MLRPEGVGMRIGRYRRESLLAETQERRQECLRHDDVYRSFTVAAQ
jgi:hypothetical protein